MNKISQDHKIHQLNAIPKKLINLFSRAIAKLILKFNISRHDYNHCLNEQLVLEAKKQNPKASKVELAVRTGIDRRFITGYLNGEMPFVRSNKLVLILSDIKWTMNEYYPGKNKMPKNGPFKTFESICEQWSSGTLTYKSILQELIRIGCLIDHGDEIELLEARRDVLKENIEYFEMSCSLINRMSDTIILNSETDDNSEQYYQMTTLSTQIPPENIKGVKKEIKAELRKYRGKTVEILERHEASVMPNTYPAYGVSFLEFNDNEVKK
jgi:DNA polymerase III alpha subunit